MFTHSLKAGLHAVRQRPGLAFLIYGMNLAVAFVLAVPLYSTLVGVVGETGFGSEGVYGFDLLLWADILEEAGTLFSSLAAQLFWMVPLYLVWKVASVVGLVNALRGGGGRSFWQGVGAYTGRGLLLALCFVPLLIGLGLGLVVLGLILGALWSGEVGLFWSNFVLLPTLLIAGLAVLDLMHDYARIALVTEAASVGRAFKTGLRWPFRYGTSSRLYVAWFAVAALLLAAPVVLDMTVAAALPGTIWLLFLMQQVVMVLRAGVTVGWIGSEVALFEEVRYREAPLIAEAEAVVPEAVPGDDQPGTLASV